MPPGKEAARTAYPATDTGNKSAPCLISNCRVFELNNPCERYWMVSDLRQVGHTSLLRLLRLAGALRQVGTRSRGENLMAHPPERESNSRPLSYTGASPHLSLTGGAARGRGHQTTLEPPSQVERLFLEIPT